MPPGVGGACVAPRVGFVQHRPLPRLTSDVASFGYRPNLHHGFLKVGPDSTVVSGWVIHNHS